MPRSIAMGRGEQFQPAMGDDLVIDVDVPSKQATQHLPEHRFLIEADEMYDSPTGGRVAWSESGRGCCNDKTLLCLRVVDQFGQAPHNEWSLAPIRVSALVGFAERILAYYEKGADVSKETLQTCHFFKDLKGRMSIQEGTCFKDPDKVSQIVQHLNVLTADPLLNQSTHMLEFLELSPIPEGSDRSKSFDSNNKRKTIREGYCFLANRNVKMVCFRRLIQFLISFLVSCFMFGLGVAIIQAIHDHQGPGVLLEYMVLLGSCITVFFLIQCAPHMCNRTFRRMPAPYEFNIWLVLTEDHLEFYYKRSHVVDGFPPEAVLFLLPGIHIRDTDPNKSTLESVLKNLSTCQMFCARYEFEVVSSSI